MPKGALLHAHLDATVNAEYLLELAYKYDAVHVRVHQPLQASNLSNNLPEFRFLPQEDFSTLESLTDDSYLLGSWVPLKNARSSFSQELGGQEGFDKWVIGSMTINPTEAYVTHNTIMKVCFNFDHLAKFASTISMIRSGKSSLVLS